MPRYGDPVFGPGGVYRPGTQRYEDYFAALGYDVEREQEGGGPSYLQGFQQERGGRLADLLGEEFLPELERARERRGQFEGTFLDFLDPARGEEFVTRGAERVAADVLRPGGPITEAIRRARGGAIASGFGTQGGDLSRQESSIVSEGLRSAIGAYIGQALPGLYEGAAGRATTAFGLTQQQVQDLIESLYTGVAGAESLKLATQRDKFLGLF